MSEIPEHGNPQDRIEWILNRAEKLEFLSGEDWIASEIEKHWDYPAEFEEGGLFDPPDDASKDMYIMFKLGMLFGIDYEYYYPTGNKEEWIDHE